MTLSSDTKRTIVFVVLGVVAWQVARTYSNSDVVALAALVGIGVVIPTFINERRA